MANKNKNGSVNYGVMQVNSLWVKELNHPDYSERHLQFYACKNVAVSAWVLSKKIAYGRELGKS